MKTKLTSVKLISATRLTIGKYEFIVQGLRQMEEILLSPTFSSKFKVIMNELTRKPMQMMNSVSGIRMEIPGEFQEDLRRCAETLLKQRIMAGMCWFEYVKNAITFPNLSMGALIIKIDETNTASPELFWYDMIVNEKRKLYFHIFDHPVIESIKSHELFYLDSMKAILGGNAEQTYYALPATPIKILVNLYDDIDDLRENFNQREEKYLLNKPLVQTKYPILNDEQTTNYLRIKRKLPANDNNFEDYWGYTAYQKQMLITANRSGGQMLNNAKIELAQRLDSELEEDTAIRDRIYGNCVIPIQEKAIPYNVDYLKHLEEQLTNELLAMLSFPTTTELGVMKRGTSSAQTMATKSQNAFMEKCAIDLRVPLTDVFSLLFKKHIDDIKGFVVVLEQSPMIETSIVEKLLDMHAGNPSVQEEIIAKTLNFDLELSSIDDIDRNTGKKQKKENIIKDDESDGESDDDEVGANVRKKKSEKDEKSESRENVKEKKKKANEEKDEKRNENDEKSEKKKKKRKKSAKDEKKKSGKDEKKDGKKRKKKKKE